MASNGPPGADGTLAPIPAGARDGNIAIVGGRWEDCCTRRAGYGRTGMFNLLPRKKGNFYGVSTLMFFNNCDHVSVVGATLERTESPARRYSIRGVIEKIDRPE